MKDFWDGCYSNEHKKEMPPEEFKTTFCENCMNVQCVNSKGSGTSWIKRISTQEERLLRNPNFADLEDSKFRRWAEMDFKNLVQEALAIEISSQKGDWSIPTPQEVGREAAAMLGITTPTSWVPVEKPPEVKPPPALPEPDLDDEEDIQPPKKLVDEVQTTDLYGNPTKPEVLGSWKILGDSGSVWNVVQEEGGVWKCNCPAFTYRGGECKHILDIQRKLQRSSSPPPEKKIPEPPPPPPTPSPKSNEAPPPGIAPVFHPRGEGNTRLPEGGLFLGKPGETPPPKEPDPWALPPTNPPLNERVIPLGGRVQFKKK